MHTLSKLCADYLAAHEFDLEDSTKDTTERACKWFDLYARDMPLAEIDDTAGDGFKAWLVKTGRSKGTANMYLRAVKPVFNWAVRKHRLAANPWLEVSTYAVTKRPVTVYEDWQFERMLHFLPKPTKLDPDRDVRWLGILWGARTTGLRRGELLNLTNENIRGGMVWVEPKTRGPATWPWEPKDREIRKVPLAPQFAEVLAYFRGRLYPLVAPFMVERVLAWQRAGKLSSRWRKCPELNFGRTFELLQKRAFGQHIGDFHQFRRTYTTEMSEYLPDKALMELTGHTRRETLDRYTAVRRSHLQVAFDVVSSVLKRGPGVLQGLRPAEFTHTQHTTGTPNIGL